MSRRQVNRVWGQASHIRMYLRVPRDAWPYVRQGIQTEFRDHKRSPFLPYVTPRPVVLWSSDRLRNYSATMAVLLEAWREPLGAISDESIRRENCESMTEFRRRWARTHHTRGFQPTAVVNVYRVRPWEPQDARDFADTIFWHLYGPFLDGVARSSI